MPVGSFLFRFSSTVGFLTTSIATLNGVSNVRVSFKKEDGKIVFQLEDTCANSLDGIKKCNPDTMLVACDRAIM
jgi:hypothetical protein